MRLRNVKNKEEIMNSSSLLVRDEAKYKENWKSLFNNDNPIYIEIGMGKGDFIIGNALNNPNINYIGIEKYDSVMARAIEKIKDDIPNLRLVRMDAKDIENVFYKEVDRVYLNFSDPWPKKRHAERRLTSNTFLKKYDSVPLADHLISCDSAVGNLNNTVRLQGDVFIMRNDNQCLIVLFI